jgi:hypothetical protein
MGKSQMCRALSAGLGAALERGIRAGSRWMPEESQKFFATANHNAA